MRRVAQQRECSDEDADETAPFFPSLRFRRRVTSIAAAIGLTGSRRRCSGPVVEENPPRLLRDHLHGEDDAGGKEEEALTPLGGR